MDKLPVDVPYVSTSTPTSISVAATNADLLPPKVTVGAGGDPPVKELNPNDLRQVGEKLNFLFRQYVADRRIAELRWLRNERQYLGVYDPEVEREFAPNRSRAYPRLTRIKCVSVLSRLMHLMFPGNEQNWEIKASPNPDLTVEEVQEAIADAKKRDQEQGIPSQVDLDYIMSAIRDYVDKRAEKLTTLILDQLEELGGDQTLDYVQLNRKV